MSGRPPRPDSARPHFTMRAGARYPAGIFGAAAGVACAGYYGCPCFAIRWSWAWWARVKMLSFTPGRDYEVVFVSFDPRENPPMAAQKKEAAMSHFGRRRYCYRLAFSDRFDGID